MTDPSTKYKMPKEVAARKAAKKMLILTQENVPKIANEFMLSKSYKVVGSWRREVERPKDIDILYFGKNLQRLLKRLNGTHKNKWTVYSEGKAKASGIFMSKLGPVKIDIWQTDSTPDVKSFMIMYATGSSMWNIVMRSIAKKKGMLLNQYGLFNLDKSGKRTRIPDLTTERKIYAALGIKYKQPRDR